MYFFKIFGVNSLEEKRGQRRPTSYFGVPKLGSFIPMEYFHAM